MITLMRPTMRRALIATAATTLTLAAAAPAHATWSLVSADSDTGQVGAAIASCVALDPLEAYLGDDGALILLAVVPGVGAGVSQAQLNPEAPVLMREQLLAGASADEVISSVTEPTFDPDLQNRQHAVITLADASAPSAFTGTENPPWAGSASGPGVSAQGNTLVSESVVTDAVDAYDATGGAMDSRLAAALLAGSRAGGDDRCGDQTALFAQVAVSTDDGTLRVHTVTVTEGDGRNPAELLAEEIASDPAVAAESDSDSTTTALLVVGVIALLGLIVGAGTTFARRRRRSRTSSE